MPRDPKSVAPYMVSSHWLIRLELEVEDLGASDELRGQAFVRWLTPRLHTFRSQWDLRHQEDIVICSQSFLFDLHTIVNTIVNINVIVKSSV